MFDYSFEYRDPFAAEEQKKQEGITRDWQIINKNGEVTSTSETTEDTSAASEPNSMEGSFPDPSEYEPDFDARA